MNIMEMTKKDFQAIENSSPTKPFSGFVIVPTGKKHDSGYGCMKFVLTSGDEIVGCVGGYSDVVHLNGIGGYGTDWERALATGYVPVTDWNIDLLPKSKCVRVFSHKGMTLPEDAWIGSDFEVYGKGKQGGE